MRRVRPLSPVESRPLATSAGGSQSSKDGLLIINADDWGRDVATTDRIFECVARHSVTAVSGMVFMEDSERAAALTREHSIDTGLHLNLTSPLTSRDCPVWLTER